MNYFRRGSKALLTRVYPSTGNPNEWGDKVHNITVSEALRTRGKDAVSVIEKEVGQMIEKKEGRQ